jgi:hypothetical protein
LRALALLRPKLLVEIGSGNSTMFARRAIEDHRLPTRIVSLDSQPRAEIDVLADQCLRTGLAHVALALFYQVQTRDVVFCDGSHRTLQNSDVTVFFVDVLPGFPKGVLVGIHVIFWPENCPPSWRRRYYSEQYMLAAYMLGAGTEFDLVLWCAWAGKHLDCGLLLIAPVNIQGRGAVVPNAPSEDAVAGPCARSTGAVIGT